VAIERLARTADDYPFCVLQSRAQRPGGKSHSIGSRADNGGQKMWHPPYRDTRPTPLQVIRTTNLVFDFPIAQAAGFGRPLNTANVAVAADEDGEAMRRLVECRPGLFTARHSLVYELLHDLPATAPCIFPRFGELHQTTRTSAKAAESAFDRNAPRRNNAATAVGSEPI
jgi:hypothetical protein